MIEISSDPRKSLAIIGYIRKSSENVRKRYSGLWTNFGKSSEIFGKWSEIFGKSPIYILTPKGFGPKAKTRGGFRTPRV